MSVLGFDIGNLNCYIGVARQGGIEVITNDYSLHATPACVSFGPKDRSMGVAARQAVTTNIKNTVINFKHLIGRKFSDPVAQRFIPFIPCKVVKLPNDDIGVQVSYLGEPHTFTPEQVLAALLTKLRTIVESQLSDVKKVSDCVLAVPSYFTDVQRRAVLSAIQYAGLNSLRIVNETTAIALAYGIYKQDLPEEDAKSRNVVFLDIGHSSTQASLVAFNRGKLQMVNTSYDLESGGIWFDALIREHFRKEFKTKYGIDAATSPRPWLRLLDECERVKKQMSANQTPIPLNIECFMEDKDVTGKMQRQEFEDLAAPIFNRIKQVLINLFADGVSIKPEEIDEIEIVGGSSRIPMIREIVKDLFGKEPKTTMNQDEAVARGAAMQCAILSPTFRVREFAIKDTQPYRIRLSWNSTGENGGENDVFSPRDEVPFSKLVSLLRSGPFNVEAHYAQPNVVPHNQVHIGSWKVNGARPGADGGNQKVKVKVRVNPDGIFTIASATMYEPRIVEEVPAEAMEVDGDAKTEAPAEPLEPVKKTKLVPVDLEVIESIPVSYDVQKFHNLELQMQESDAREKAKADAKNSLEEYVYEMRDKVSDQYAEFITPAAADEFRSVLTSTEDWLYDEGEDAERDVYEKRLSELKAVGTPVVERYRESETRKPAFDSFDQSIMRVRKAYEDYANGGPTYAHLDSKEMEKVINAIEDKKKWLDEARHKQETRSKTDAPVVFTEEILQNKNVFENVVNPILNKKKPAAPAPPKKEEPQPAAGDQPQSQPGEMDVD
ncbi:Heat shock protein 110 [Caenorhabditis elegans]|uniref:Heat shock protein 110 n=1 Tax=Caenorhabditis elegans TaxID=6239 RepID=HS110_CAEEL|nr:Heat shock protein 110 [Caenorhabditis elegans]Q05036.1 RecName: Full=Heat shock protein 110 [Caenorhabditis elegans]CCD66159.1 Heat shock protein 110 [Caenorhabditis elegans]|eukprot:NP_498868.1 Heat shock protein 110 [Caenorhabditis elegans]